VQECYWPEASFARIGFRKKQCKTEARDDKTKRTSPTSAQWPTQCRAMLKSVARFEHVERRMSNFISGESHSARVRAVCPKRVLNFRFASTLCYALRSHTHSHSHSAPARDRSGEQHKQQQKHKEANINQQHIVSKAANQTQ
jgi:hypothetical protein